MRTQQLQTRYFALIPAIYFMIIGIVDIGMDMWTHKLTGLQTFFNALFLLPIIFQHRKINLICGACFSILGFFLLIAGLLIMPNNPLITTLQAVAVATLLLLSFIFALSLWYSGIQFSTGADMVSSNYEQN